MDLIAKLGVQAHFQLVHFGFDRFLVRLELVQLTLQLALFGFLFS